MVSWFIRILSVLLLVGCRSQKDADVLYPLLDRLEGPFDYVLSRSALERWEADDWHVLQLLEQARLALHIGTEEKERPEYLLGRVMDADIDPQGRIAVLDFANGEVRFFDRAGNYLFTIGRPGEGPGEFERPERLAFDRQGRLYVLDGGRRIQRFRPEGDTYVLDHTYMLSVQLKAGVRGFCLFEDTLYVQTMSPLWHERPTLHVLDLEGRVVWAFGRLDFYPWDAVEEEAYRGIQPLLGEATLYCDPYGPGLILVYPYFGVIAYYSTQGARRWLVRTEEQALFAIKILDVRASMPMPRPRGFVVHNVLALPAGKILIHGASQVMHEDDPYKVASQETYLYIFDREVQRWSWAPVEAPFFKVYRLGTSWILGTRKGADMPHVAVFQLGEASAPL